jgi:hypothetical protein
MTKPLDTEALRASIARNAEKQIFAAPVLLDLIAEVERLRDENRILRDQLHNHRRKTR